MAETATKISGSAASISFALQAKNGLLASIGWTITHWVGRDDAVPLERQLTKAANGTHYIASPSTA